MAATQATTTRTGRSALKQAWHAERQAAKAARGRGDLTDEWRHLERAHILSQPLAGAHLATHSAMLGSAVRRRDAREVAGQLARLVLAVPGSVSGRYPVGNSGGANVSAFRPMLIPEDLQTVLDAAGGGR